MEDRFGCGAIVRAMRPEEREEMLGLLPAATWARHAEAVVSTDRQRGYVRALVEMGVAAHERFASSGPRGSLDGLVGAVCLAFELDLPASRKALGDRGYLQALLREPFGLSPHFESELTQYRWNAICDVMGRFHVC